MSDALLNEITDLVKQHTGAKTVTAETRLYSDLGMTGDDAEEFLKAFIVKFEPDMGGLVWQRYFDDETATPDMLEPAFVLGASLLSPGFAVRWQAARDAERDITVAHLAEVARTKTWRDSDLKRAPKPTPLPMVLFSLLTLLTMVFFVALAPVVTYAFLAGKLGDQQPLVLVGIVAIGLLPIYAAYACWRRIQSKLNSAPRI